MNEDDVVLRSGRTPSKISEFINEKIIAQSAPSTETPRPHSASPISASSNSTSSNSTLPNLSSPNSASPHSVLYHSTQSDISFESSHKNTERIQSSFPITINEQFYDHEYDVPLGLNNLSNISKLINERLQPEASSLVAFEGYNLFEINCNSANSTFEQMPILLNSSFEISNISKLNTLSPINSYNSLTQSNSQFDRANLLLKFNTTYIEEKNVSMVNLTESYEKS